MGESKNHDLAFTITPIQDSIFRHGGLSPHDLANASKVSRAWFQIVTPFLWENIIITTVNANQEWSEGFKSGLASHGQWTRTLTTTSDDVLYWFAEYSTGTRLTIIDATRLADNREDRNSMQKLVSQHPFLQVLRWRRVRWLGHQQYNEVFNGLMKPNSRFLTTIDFSRITLKYSFYELLKHHLATMKHLLLEFCVLDADESLVFDHNDNQGLNLKSLVLEETRFRDAIDWVSVDCFASFIRLMNGLVEFTLATDYQGLIRQVTRLFMMNRDSIGQDAGPLAFLDTLCVKYMNGISLPGEVMEELLDALPCSLSRLSLDAFSVGDLGNLALRNFAKRNQDRLTSITLSYCQNIESETWETILTSCRCLKEIEEIVSCGLKIKTGCKDPWVCLDLEQFKMTVEVDAGWFDESKKFVLEDCEKFFSQLAALRQLKRLNIEIHGSRLNPIWVNEAKEQFMLLWSRMQVCTNLQEVKGVIRFPTMRIEATELQKLSREMWGDHVKIRIEV